jgi:prepilin-type N-terminal cleavage/methylation domain-containing protein
MNANADPSEKSRPLTASSQAAFTLPEVYVAMAVLLVAIAAVLSTQIYGLHMFEIIKPKLAAADEARLALSKLTDEVRTASFIRIGAGSADSFTEVPLNTAQQGNALQIYIGTDTNQFVRYYWESGGRRLMRLASGDAPLVIANCVSNEMVFTSEDFAGNIITNNRNNRVIGLTLQFYQIQYPIIEIGPGNFYDFYQLKTKITRRTLL